MSQRFAERLPVVLAERAEQRRDRSLPADCRGLSGREAHLRFGERGAAILGVEEDQGA
jgi:hypothetical protein